eukprot:8743627-Pyramimonas_sp.AAC.1
MIGAVPNIALGCATSVCKMSFHPRAPPSCPRRARPPSDVEIVEKAIENTGPLRGRVGPSLAE